MKIKDIQSALEIFEDARIKHSEAIEQGDYKAGNKYHSKIMKAIAFLKNENAITNLKDYLSNPNIGVRLWSASYWLPVNEQEGIRVLEEIVKTQE